MRSNSIVKVEFRGGELEAVKKDGKVWVSVRRVCEALGIDVESQRKKLKDEARAPWAVTVMMTATGPDGKNYQTFMIDLDSFPMWLGTIDASRVREEIRPMLITYQKEAAIVLRDHFFGKRTETPEEKEARLWARERRLMAQQKARGWRIFRRLAEESQRTELVKTFDVRIAETLTGDSHPELLPVAGERAEWMSPAEIGEQLDVTAHRVGLTISELWGRGRDDIEDIREVRMSTAPNGKQITMSYYSPRAVALIKQRLTNFGYCSVEETPVMKMKRENLDLYPEKYGDRP
jgi:hypothetical protein